MGGFNFIETLTSVTIDGSKDCDAQMTPQCSVPIDIITEDGVDTGDGSFNAQLTQITDNMSGYRIQEKSSPTADDPNIINVNVVDDVQPVIVSMSATELNIVESDNAALVFNFTVEDNPISQKAIPTTDLTINYTINQKELDFLTDSSNVTKTKMITQMELSSLPINIMETIELVNDEVDEPGGLIEVTLLKSLEYNIKDSGNTIFFRVSDDDAAPIIITMSTAETTDLTPVESDEAAMIVQFTVSENPISPSELPMSNLTINYSINQNKLDFLTDSSVTRTKVITPAEFSALPINIMETIQIENDDDDEPGGQITLTLEPGIGYEVDESANNTITFSVADDDEPVISISLYNNLSNRSENTADPTFILTADQAPWQDINVTFSASDEILNCISDVRVGTIYAETTSSEVSIISNDTDSEDDCLDGMITLTDDDNAGDNGYSIHSSDNNITITIRDDDGEDLIVSIHTINNAEAFYENSDHQLILSVPRAPTKDLTINYRITQSGGGDTNFIDDNGSLRLTKMVEIPTGETEVRVGVLLDNDDDDEEATITVQLLDDVTADNGYFLVENQIISFTVYSEDGDRSVTIQPVINEMTHHCRWDTQCE